jgi:hypothetical protein
VGNGSNNDMDVLTPIAPAFTLQPVNTVNMAESSSPAGWGVNINAAVSTATDELKNIYEPNNSLSADGRPGRKWGRTKPTGPISRDLISSRDRKRKIVLGVVIALIGALALHATITVLKPSVSADEVAAEVIANSPGDGEYAAVAAIGAQFLRAYLPTDPTTLKTRQETLISLAGNSARNWIRNTTGEKASPLIITSGPDLVKKPQLSVEFLDTITVTYRTIMANPDGEQTIITMAVPVYINPETGVATVAGPPALLPTVPTDDTSTIKTRANEQNDDTLSTAIKPQVTQFFTDWAAKGPNTPADTATRLEAWLAPNAGRNASTGLNGVVRLDNIVSISAPKTGPDFTGPRTLTVTVQWKTVNQDVYTQAYQIDVVPGPGDGRWLVDGLRAL